MSNSSLSLDTPSWVRVCWVVNGFSSLFLSSYGFHLVWFVSPKEMVGYKWYLLAIVVFTCLCDGLMNLVMRPVVLFPLWGGYSDGIISETTNAMLAQLNILEGDGSHFLPIAMAIVNNTSASMVCGFLYRYWVLDPTSWIMREKLRPHLVTFIFHIVTFLPGSIVVFIAREPKEKQKAYIREFYPELSFIIPQTTWVIFDPGIEPNSNWSYILLSIMLSNALSYLFIAIFAINRTLAKLDEMKVHMSQATFKMHSTLLRSLCFQAGAPAVLYCGPILTAFILFYIKWTAYIQEICYILAVLFGMNSITNVIFMTYFTKPYRVFTLKLLRKMKIIKGGEISDDSWASPSNTNNEENSGIY